MKNSFRVQNALNQYSSTAMRLERASADEAWDEAKVLATQLNDHSDDLVDTIKHDLLQVLTKREIIDILTAND